MTKNSVGDPLDILLVEDNPGDARLLEEYLSEAELLSGDLDRVGTLEAALDRLRNGATPPDVVLQDLGLPDANGLDAVKAVVETAPDRPVVVLTARDDRETALAALRQGAEDYLAKGEVGPDLLGRAVRYGVERKRAERKLERSEERWSTALQLAPVGLVISRIDNGEVLTANEAMEAILGYDRGELLSSTVEDLGTWPDRDQRRNLVERVRSEERVEDEEIQMRHRSGESRTIRASARLLEMGGDDTLLWALQDVTEQKRLEEQLRHRALHDRLTGLPNRTLFWDRLEHALDRSRRNEEAVAVVFVDLDGFGRINDEHGHAAGDEALRRVADRLRSTVRDADTLARLGGDEFGVLLEDVESPSDAEAAAGRITDRFGPPVSVAGEEALLRVSCGIAVARGGADAEVVAADELVQRADRAMYGAKEEPGSACRVYGPEVADGDRPGRLRREIELQDALGRGDVVPFFQPIVDLEDGRVVGAEALARWVHREQGTITPGDFIPLAEQTGLIVELGREISRSAVAQMFAWKEEGVLSPDFRLHLNLSATEVDRPDIVEFLDGLFREWSLEAMDVAVEVTESVAVERADALGQIRELGSPVAVDDFGTQYATLERLASLDLDALKLDRLFVSRIGESERHEAVLEASLTLARSMGLCPVAEGVDSERQREWLLEYGCQYAQGFLFGRAVPAEELTGWLRSGQTLPD